MTTIKLTKNILKKSLKKIFSVEKTSFYKLQKNIDIKFSDICNFFEQLNLLEEKFSLKSRAAAEKDSFIEAAHLLELDRLGLETDELKYPQQVDEIYTPLKEENETHELGLGLGNGEENKQDKSVFLFDNFVKIEDAELFDETDYLQKQSLFYNVISFFDFFFKTKSMILNNLVSFDSHEYELLPIKNSNKDKHLHTIILNATTRNFYITVLTPEKTKLNNLKLKKESTALIKLLNTKYKINFDRKQHKEKKKKTPKNIT